VDNVVSKETGASSKCPAGEIKRLQEAITVVRRLAQNIEDDDLRIQIISA